MFGMTKNEIDLIWLILKTLKSNQFSSNTFNFDRILNIKKSNPSELEINSFLIFKTHKHEIKSFPFFLHSKQSEKGFYSPTSHNLVQEKVFSHKKPYLTHTAVNPIQFLGNQCDSLLRRHLSQDSSVPPPTMPETARVPLPNTTA